MEWTGPILDNHLHLDARNGRGVAAAREFVDAGGTDMLVVNNPSWRHDVEVSRAEDYRVAFSATVSIAQEASESLPGTAWPVLGVHPALVSRLVDTREMRVDEARRLMCEGIDVAAEFVAADEALALKSGRPHYPVSDEVWEASNAVLRHAIERAVECSCALQLHTESTVDLTDVVEWADSAGLPPASLVKHYADGPVAGPIPSMIARKDALERAIAAGRPFLMETDFLDDPDRPGAVLGPKTVPRRVEWLANAGALDAIETAHVETPEIVYGLRLRR